MKKKVLASVLTAVLAVSVLSACGSSSASTDASAEASTEETAAEESTEAAEETEEAEAADTEAADGDLTVIKVAASATPHAEILEKAKDLLKDKGYDLEVTVFDDYVQPNLVVESGEFDANYFQHVPYLDSFNEEKGTHLVVAGKIHYEPFGIYPGTKSSLEDLADGDTIAVPNDTTNEARALLLLQDNGVLTLKEGAGLEATVNDIVDNPLNLKFEELEAAQIPHVIGEVALEIGRAHV